MLKTEKQLAVVLVEFVCLVLVASSASVTTRAHHEETITTTETPTTTAFNKSEEDIWSSPPNNDDFRTFYGTPSQKLDQFIDYLHLKSAIKAKAHSCRLRGYCEHWKTKSLFFQHHLAKPWFYQYLNGLVPNQESVGGAIAAGLLQLDCSTRYRKCDTFITIVTSMPVLNEQVAKPLGLISTADHEVALTDEAIQELSKQQELHPVSSVELNTDTEQAKPDTNFMVDLPLENQEVDNENQFFVIESTS